MRVRQGSALGRLGVWGEGSPGGSALGRLGRSASYGAGLGLMDPRHPEPYFLILSSRARVSLLQYELFSGPGFRVRVQGVGFRVGPGRFGLRRNQRQGPCG